MAAALSCGEGAVLSHGSAAALWDIGKERTLPEVSIQRASHLRRSDLVLHRRTGLGPKDITVHHRIPVTTPAMTLLDHACRLSRGSMERMINQADKLGLIKPPALRAFLEEHPRREGVGRLKDLLDRRTLRYTEPGLEQAFLPLAAEAGLPLPLTQQRLNGFKADFYWPELGLVVETDGLTYHRTPAEQARDRLRDQAHTAAGLTPLRFTHEQVKYEAGHVRRVLAATAARLAHPGP
jgi:very-short-patch-repair endonuclease